MRPTRTYAMVLDNGAPGRCARVFLICVYMRGGWIVVDTQSPSFYAVSYVYMRRIHSTARETLRITRPMSFMGSVDQTFGRLFLLRRRSRKIRSTALTVRTMRTMTTTPSPSGPPPTHRRRKPGIWRRQSWRPGWARSRKTPG